MEPLQLYSVDRAPRTLPVWDTIISDLGNPPAARIARTLGVGRSTVYRWQAEGGGPRIACLALFWLTRWGRSEIHTAATNDAIRAVRLARSLDDERQKLTAEVARLSREAQELTLALSQQKPPAHGNAAIADGSHSHTSPEARPGESAATPPAGLQWPALALPELPALPALSVLPLAPSAPASAPADQHAPGRSGSASTPPRAAHSSGCQAGPRAPEPQASRAPGVAVSSPRGISSVSVSNHSATEEELWAQYQPASGHLLVLRQAQQDQHPVPHSASMAAPLSAPVPAGSVLASSPAPGRASILDRSHASAVPVGHQVEYRFHGAQAPGADFVAPAPAGKPVSADASLPLADQALPGRSAPSATRPERPVSAGQDAPHPPPRAADPGAAAFLAFAALVRATTTPEIQP